MAQSMAQSDVVSTAMSEKVHAISRKRLFTALLVVAVVAISIRVILLIAVGPVFGAGGDDAQYRQLALNLLEMGRLGGQGERPPGYPVFLAGIWALTGEDHFLAVALVQAAVGITTSFLWFLIIWLITRSLSLSTLAGIIYSLNLPVTTIELRLMTETLIAFWVALIIALVILFIEKDCRPKWLLGLSGIAAGLLASTHVAFAGFVTVPLLTLLVSSVSRCKNRRGELLSSVVVLLTPWMIFVGALISHNRVVFGYTGLTTYMGYNLTNPVCNFFHLGPENEQTQKIIKL